MSGPNSPTEVVRALLGEGEQADWYAGLLFEWLDEVGRSCLAEEVRALIGETVVAEHREECGGGCGVKPCECQPGDRVCGTCGATYPCATVHRIEEGDGRG